MTFVRNGYVCKRAQTKGCHYNWWLGKLRAAITYNRKVYKAIERNQPPAEQQG